MTNENVSVKVSSLSKTYKLYGSRYHVIGELVHPFRKKYHTRFNALKNVSFELKKGEVMGIIGRNGSGKSTLLKILSSVVTQTAGSFDINGRYSSLLELGGGFNKDLTGVENVYFLGGIQGYSKEEMKKRLHQILDFAEIGQYAWQPVKTYSSGMYVRLAFSIAIHIDPDVLIIDEALAVGDLRFQQKCFRRIREFKENGKTILLCSHSLGAVNDFCSRAIWLHQGSIKLTGDPKKVTDAYTAFMNENGNSGKPDKLNSDNQEKISDTTYQQLIHKYLNTNWINLKSFDSFGNDKAKMKYAAFLNADTGKPFENLRGGENIRVMVCIEKYRELINPGAELQLTDKHGTTIFRLNNYVYRKAIRAKENIFILTIDFQFPAIANGKYTFSLIALNRENQKTEHLHWVHDALILNVNNPDVCYKKGGIVVIEKANFKAL